MAITLESIRKINIKESLAINARVLLALKQQHSQLTLKQLKKIVLLIPDYNPKDEQDAILIGKRLIWKAIMTNQIGGNI